MKYEKIGEALLMLTELVGTKSTLVSLTNSEYYVFAVIDHPCGILSFIFDGNSWKLLLPKKEVNDL